MNARPDPIVVALAGMQHELAASRQANEVLLKASQDATAANRQANEILLKTNQDTMTANLAAMKAMMQELRTMKEGPPPPLPPPPPASPPPHTATLTLNQGGESEGNHHTGEGSHRVEVEQPRADVVAAQARLDRRLNAFRRHKPPSFGGSFDPVDAVKWMQAMEKIFRLMQCADDERLLFSIYMLEGDAHEWWTNVTHPMELQGQVITWQMFDEMFLERYFSQDARERKQGEFERLEQGSMSMDEYLAKFNELAKFASFRGVMPTPAYLAAKFHRDFNDLF